MARTYSRTVERREHWRWQRCGKDRSELRRVHVRASLITLAPTDTRQLDMLETNAARTAVRHPAARAATRPSTDPRPVLRSYWRRQPFGPGSALRKTILVNVHR